MAARLIGKKISPASWINGVLRPPGMDRRGTVPYTASTDIVKTKDVFVELWKNKFAVEQQRLKFASSGIVTTPTTTTKDTRDAEYWMNKLEEGRNIPLLSVQHHRGTSQGGQGILKFTTTTESSLSKQLISVKRLGLEKRPGPFDLQRQTVEGVVCITTKDAFLLYSPSTGVASPWIETSTSTREGRQVKSIALGFDPRSKKHKVVCISSYNVTTAPGTETTEEEENFVVEVLNVRKNTWTSGAHKWRKLKDDDVPYPGARVTLEDRPVYLDGKIHWQYHRSFHRVLKFDLGKETFVITPFPKPLDDELTDSPPKIRSMLMLTLKLIVVEGKIAILRSTSGQKTSSLWILHVKEGKTSWRCWPEIEWKEEKVLTGTVTNSDPTAFYNRKMKVPPGIPTLPISDRFDPEG